MKKILFSLIALCLLTSGLAQAEHKGHVQLMQIIERHDVLKGMPINTVADTATVLLFPQGWAIGVYDVRAKQSFVAENAPYEAMKYAALHEGAHYILDYVNPAFRRAYCDAYQKNGLSVSRYGRLDCDENFAEIFAFLNGSRHHMYSGLDGYLDGSAQKRIVEAVIADWLFNRRTR